MQKCRIGEHIKSSAPKENGTDGSLALYSPFSACTGGAKSGLSTFTENKTDCTSSLSYYILDNLLLIRIRPSEPRASASVSTSANFLQIHSQFTNMLFV